MYAAKSHIGLVRPLNEDGYAIRESGLPMTLFVVADGMGGASAGEIASRIAVDTLTQTVADAQEFRFEHPEELLRQAVEQANQRICQTAMQVAEYAGMGTTVVAVLANRERISIAHAGDSRAYGLLAGQFCQLTQDHSLVAELVRRGQLTAEEAHRHPQRHIVTRSLGTTEYGYADVQAQVWQTGDVVLLCTDGLSNLVTDSEIEAVLRVASQSDGRAELQDLVDSLVSLALNRGGHDNITLVLAVNTEAGDAA